MIPSIAFEKAYLHLLHVNGVPQNIKAWEDFDERFKRIFDKSPDQIRIHFIRCFEGDSAIPSWVRSDLKKELFANIKDKYREIYTKENVERNELKYQYIRDYLLWLNREVIPHNLIYEEAWNKYRSNLSQKVMFDIERIKANLMSCTKFHQCWIKRHPDLLAIVEMARNYFHNQANIGNNSEKEKTIDSIVIKSEIDDEEITAIEKKDVSTNLVSWNAVRKVQKPVEQSVNQLNNKRPSNDLDNNFKKIKLDVSLQTETTDETPMDPKKSQLRLDWESKYQELNIRVLQHENTMRTRIIELEARCKYLENEVVFKNILLEAKNQHLENEVQTLKDLIATKNQLIAAKDQMIDTMKLLNHSNNR